MQAETCKYLYLLFSGDEHFVHQPGFNFVFNTEGPSSAFSYYP